ncbi:hypothetical protein QOZ88_07495 [Blastococcus sp. BMG 814]|uniref:7-cyano-7-deazaguanine synthase n=1 Tax=Blastococcus carthaginiensis TaxID=3050034 RepID=A0ABT9IA79_9ACTN|nr:hypothetical protein [Blastococcus carthaginiensis]MDP5182480.1 hypothetical protein [Blastococcus carthaginiensis]
MTGRDVERVQLLWTGGWDSSFRLMQLLLVEGRAVQPIHVLDTGRPSTLFELRAMEAMRAGLLARLPDPALLAPTRFVLASDHLPGPRDAEIGDRLLRETSMGTQYLWLSGPAAALGWSGVELCIERYESGLSDWQRRVFDEPGRLNGSPESELFRFWSFPVMHLTKEEMREIARSHGFLDLLVLRWSCFRPLDGRPCGRCRPCRLTHDEEVRFANPVLVAARDLARKTRKGLREPAAALALLRRR